MVFCTSQTDWWTESKEDWIGWAQQTGTPRPVAHKIQSNQTLAATARICTASLEMEDFSKLQAKPAVPLCQLISIVLNRVLKDSTLSDSILHLS